MDHEEIRDEVQAEMDSLMHVKKRRGRRLDSKTLRAPISQLRLRPLVTVTPESPVAAAVQAMADNRVGCVLVTSHNRLEGIFTERDVLTRVVGRGRTPEETRVREVMSADPESLTRDNMLAFALNLMHVGGYRHVPILDAEGRPQGVLSVRDVLNYLADFFPEEVLTLPPRPDGTLPLHGG